MDGHVTAGGARAHGETTSAGPDAGSAAGSVTEELRTRPGGPDLYAHAAWEREFPGLACGVTAAGSGADFGLTTSPDAWTLAGRMAGLGEAVEVPGVAMVRQVHGRRVMRVGPVPAGALLVAGDADGLVTSERGVLLAVTAADCVPVHLLDPGTGAIGLLHAGWRGAAAGVLEAGIAALERDPGVPPDRLRVHLGPAICGACYEVGPEVLRAFGREADGPAELDLRGELAARAAEAGVAPGAIGVSTWCTRCGADRFHSHRGSGGTAGRMAAFLGWRASGCPEGG